MTAIERIDIDEARRRAKSGSALLVCAYDDEEKCNKMKIEGAITMTELRAMTRSLEKDREIIFYCA